MRINRRGLLQTLAAAGAGAAFGKLARAAGKSEAHVPIRAITRGPKHHWFGYYDKLEFDPTNRYVLSNEVDFEHRSPRADDVIGVGMVDTQQGDKWIELGNSNAWGWQQGCMLQWRPGTASEIVWNDREGDRFVCHVLDVETKRRRTLPMPIYALSPDGKCAVTADFARIQNMRPGYGYAGLEDKYADEKAPPDSGIWRMNLETGQTELIISLAEMAKIPYRGKTLESKWNYFNHLLVSPDGRRFIFLHRWREDANGSPSLGFTTRMFTANLDGGGLFELDPSGRTSHFIWRDPQHVCAWTKPAGKKAAFYLFKDQTREIEIVGEGVMTRNGHNTYLPIDDNRWILNDTYPDARRLQTPYAYDTKTRKRHDLGHFYLPPKYQGEWRCDTHPRSSNDGRLVAIDSPHGSAEEGTPGRQVWLLDISEIVA